MKKIIAAAIIFLAPHTATAGFIDLGPSLIDETAGLEWLDVLTTAGLSYNTVNSTLLGSGQTYDGWRYATGDELSDLLFNWTGITQPASHSTSQSYSSNEVDLLVTALGITANEFSTGAVSTFGLLIDIDLVNSEFGNDSRYVAHIQDQDPGSNPFGGSTPGNDFSLVYSSSQLDGNSDAGIGSFLVRSVPEPATLALLGLGLAGLSLRQRRKQ